MTTSSLRAAVSDVLPSVRSDLEALVRIPSVSADPGRVEDVRRSAEATAELFRGEGFDDVRILSSDGGAPAVVARKPAPTGAQTVLLYAHHDVQPVGNLDDWDSDPFEPTERGERLYGRGAADDKAGIAAHLAAIRAHAGTPPVGVPALTTSLRGLVDVFVEVSTLEHGVHSGLWGGVAPDALTTLIRLLATLHDEEGNVAVRGLVSGPAADIDYPEDRVRSEAAMLDGVEFIGSGSLVERLWAKPAIATIGLDATRTADASNTLIPSATAKVSLRLAPGDNAESAQRKLTEHLEANVPWGARIKVTPGRSNGEPSVIKAEGPAYDIARQAFREAWDGTDPVDIGVGGSIPFISAFQAAFPHAAVLVTGVEDPDTRAHGVNEGLHLKEFGRVCLAETLLLANLALIPRA